MESASMKTRRSRYPQLIKLYLAGLGLGKLMIVLVSFDFVFVYVLLDIGREQYYRLYR